MSMETQPPEGDEPEALTPEAAADAPLADAAVGTPEDAGDTVVDSIDDLSDVAARSCSECGEAMLDSQDWCLNCGTAAPGRLGSRPGWRAVSTVTLLTLVLVMGAVAASYAAL